MNNEQVRANGLIKPCCCDKNNLKRKIIARDKCIDTCQVCECKHYRMLAEPGVIGTKYTPPVR